ncbi:MAG: glycosyltransferase, partial [Rhodoferax sp.]|uniref:glycosyltransferase n=1 Tax=Rhodoferax sp. TaxID=50421 RepID=UPI003266EA46
MSFDATHTVLVVIPTLNEVRTLEGVLHSLSQETPPGVQVTFVVTDGGSTDGTVALVQRLAKTDPRLHYLHNPRRIQSAAVNLA